MENKYTIKEFNVISSGEPYIEYEPTLSCPINNDSFSKFQIEVIEHLIKRDRLIDIDTDCIDTNELELFIITITAVKEILLSYNHSRAMEVLNNYINELEKMYYPNDPLEEIVKNMELKSVNRQEEN